MLQPACIYIKSFRGMKYLTGCKAFNPVLVLLKLAELQLRVSKQEQQQVKSREH
jgi:hypothetical protein